MAFQPHETYLEREVRALKYMILRMNGCSVKDACKMRDWTYNKVCMIIRGEGNPVGLIRTNELKLNKTEELNNN